MSQIKQIRMDTFPTYSVGEFYIDPFQTTNATEQTIGSFPVAQNQYVDVISFSADGVVNNFSDNVSADLRATFLRATGNVSRTSTSTSSGLIRNIFTSIGLLSTITIDAVANTSTNEIDFKVKGQASKTINWNFVFEIKLSNA